MFAFTLVLCTTVQSSFFSGRFGCKLVFGLCFPCWQDHCALVQTQAFGSSTVTSSNLPSGGGSRFQNGFPSRRILRTRQKATTSSWVCVSIWNSQSGGLPTFPLVVEASAFGPTCSECARDVNSVLFFWGPLSNDQRTQTARPQDFLL